MLKWYRVLMAAILCSGWSGNASGSAADGRVLVAWELWNEPPAVSSPAPKPEPKAEPETLDSLTRRAERAKKDALEALRKFEESRRLAQEAEARRLAMEQKTREQATPEDAGGPAAHGGEAVTANPARAVATDEPAMRERQPGPVDESPEAAAREAARMREKRKEEERKNSNDPAVSEEEPAKAEAPPEQTDATEADRRSSATERAPTRLPEEWRRAGIPQVRFAVARQSRPTLAALTPAVATVADVTEVKSIPAEALRGTSASDTVASYVIGPGDVLEVSVWKDESLTRSVTVSPDGTFSFPLIGAIPAAGRTVSELKTDLAQRLSVYVPEPVFSLEVKQANSMQIYVIGRVNSPGRFLIGSYVNVLQALAMAGGLNPFADEDDIRILRDLGDGQTRSHAFNYKKVLRGDHLEQNIRLQRGDVIVVP